jgi:hypothetical protein
MALTKVTSGIRTLATDEVLTANINDDAVTTAKVLDDNVTTAKILDNNVTLAKMADGTQGGTLYYGASGAPTELAAGTSGYFLKTQGGSANPVWAAAGGANTPIFLAGKTGSTTGLVNNTWYKVEFNDEIIDTGSDYDPTTNYRFTPTTAGKYFIGAVFTCGSTRDGYRYLATLYFNGANNRDAEYSIQPGAAGNESSLYTSYIFTFNGSSDYVEAYFRQESDVDTNLTGTASKFWGYKLIE